MRKLREIVRLKLQCGLSSRAIAKACGLSPSTVQDYAGRIAAARLSWPLPAELDEDAALERLLFPHEGKPTKGRPEPDWAHVHAQLRRKHVTKMLLWQEYREKQPNGYQYSQFCDLYARWAGRVSVTMRQVHRAGEKMFVDFSGDGIDIVEPNSGEVRRAKLFVAVLGGSSLTFVEPVLDESLPTWIDCHVKALEFFGGVPEILVPDNLKSGVTRPDRYEPGLNRTYEDLSRHYGCVIIPGRVRRPRDKAKVESAVLVAERWIIAVLRNRRFGSLDELRDAIEPLQERINDRPMRAVRKSRRQLFDELERDVLRPLPEQRFEFSQWKRAKVNIDYHVEFDAHFYSVPHLLVGESVEVRATVGCVEVLHGGKRVASHARSSQKHKHTTQPAHMPASHRAHLEWTPSRIIDWATKLGPSTGQLVKAILDRYRHPEQGFRSCLGIIRLEKRYSQQRLESACEWALRHRALSYRSVESILKNNRDRVQETPQQQSLPSHGNVRGPRYFH